VLTGSNPLNWGTVVNGLASVSTNGSMHYVTSPTTSYDITPSSHATSHDITTPVLVDTNMVYNRPGVDALLQPHEYPVISTTVRAEIANNASAGKIRTPNYIDDFPVIADGGDLHTRIDVRGELEQLRKNQRGLYGDGVVGAIAVDDGIPLITADKRLAQVVSGMGGEVRRP
jgi:hypothetical protein